MLLTFYCWARAGLTPLSRAMRALWLAGSALVGFTGGLERQTVYIAAAVVLIWAIWHWRRDRLVQAVVAFLLFALCAGASFVIRWQFRQANSTGQLGYSIVSWKGRDFPGLITARI